MGKIASLLQAWRSGGLAGAARLVRNRLYSRTTMFLYDRVWDPSKVAGRDVLGTEFFIRPASREDIGAIERAWPVEFRDLAPTATALRRELRRRFDEALLCFVCCTAQGRVVGALWCIPWKFDRALPEWLRGRPAFEYNSLFTVPEVRYKRLLPMAMMDYALRYLAETQGKTVAYSRATRKRRIDAVGERRFGFRRLGRLTHGTCLGRPFSRFEPDSDGTSAPEHSVPACGGPIVRKARSLAKAYRLWGMRGVLRAVGERIWRRDALTLLEKRWEAADAQRICAPPGVVLRTANDQDIPALMRAWPREFDRLAQNPTMLRTVLEKRFREQWPCFVAARSQGEILAAVWCRPWSYPRPARDPLDAAGPPYEISSLFTIPEARGSGLGGSLVLYAMSEMSRSGATKAYSRVRPGDKASLRCHWKVGFVPRGLLITGRILGRSYCHLREVSDR